MSPREEEISLPEVETSLSIDNEYKFLVTWFKTRSFTILEVLLGLRTWIRNK